MLKNVNQCGFAIVCSNVACVDTKCCTKCTKCFLYQFPLNMTGLHFTLLRMLQTSNYDADTLQLIVTEAIFDWVLSFDFKFHYRMFIGFECWRNHVECLYFYYYNFLCVLRIKAIFFLNSGEPKIICQLK